MLRNKRNFGDDPLGQIFSCKFNPILSNIFRVIRHLISGNNLAELASELESDLRDTVDWGKKWFVDFNAGKTELVSFD